MRIGILNNSFNQNRNNQNLKFKARRLTPISGEAYAQEIITRMHAAIASKKANPASLKTVLKEALELIKNRDCIKYGVVETTLFKYNFNKNKGHLTKKFNSNNIKKQKEVISSLFKLTENADSKGIFSGCVDKYIFEKIVPHIQKNKNKELADYVLNNMPKVEYKPESVYKIKRRINLIAALGNKDQHSIELNKYTSVPYAYHDQEYCFKESIKLAKQTIEKLQTNPDF